MIVQDRLPRFSYRTGIAIDQLLHRALLPAAVVVAAAGVALLPLPAAAGLAAAGGLALAILVKPWLGLPLLAVAVPFAAVRPLSLSGMTLDATDLLLAWIVVAWLAQGVARRHLEIPRAALTAVLAVFVLAISLSLANASSWREALPELAKWLQVAVLYLCVVAVLPAQRVGWLLGAILLAAVAQAALGIYQFLSQSGPEAFYILGRFARAAGTFRQPNPYAGYLGLVAPLAVTLALWAWARPQAWSRKAWLARLILPGAAAVILLGVLASWSRGAWLALAVALTAAVLGFSRRSAPVILVSVGLVVAAGLVFGLADLLPASVIGRISELGEYLGFVDLAGVEVTDANFSVMERVAHWQAAIKMWADRPWLGVGIGNYAVAYPRYALPRWQEPLGHAHNVYLNFGAETGLVGLVAYGALWLAFVVQALRSLASRSLFTVAVGAGILGALVHASVHNVFDNLWVQHVYLVLSLLMGSLAVLMGRDHALRQP
jgi:O-antigen ligase